MQQYDIVTGEPVAGRIAAGLPVQVNARTALIRDPITGAVVSITNDITKCALSNALAKEYEGDKEQHAGKTKFEAMTDSVADKAADGDLDAVNIVFDRTVGKPKQTVESVNVNTTLAEYLDEVRKNSGVIDAD